MSGLTRDDIDQILKLIDGSDFDHLKLEMGDMKLELHKSGSVQTAASTNDALAAAAPAAAIAAPVPPSATAAPTFGGTAVPAPLLGTFYHASKPGAAPFVVVGDHVEAESVIGIIEVMKLMNQVEAGVSGVVTEIVAPNGELVEHGQTLIRVKTD